MAKTFDRLAVIALSLTAKAFLEDTAERAVAYVDAKRERLSHGRSNPESGDAGSATIVLVDPLDACVGVKVEVDDQAT